MKRAKYFHHLTKAEFEKLPKDMKWSAVAEKYPQPKWCEHPDAVSALGCWSLLSFYVTGKKYCSGCECYKKSTGAGVTA